MRTILKNKYNKLYATIWKAKLRSYMRTILKNKYENLY